MAPTDRATIDRRSAEAADDLRALASVWVSGGSAALDAAVRTNPVWTFAERQLPAAVELFAMRASEPPNVITLDPPTADAPMYREVLAGGDARMWPEIVLTFGASTGGERAVIARGDGDLVLVSDPKFEVVTVAPSDSAFAEEMAWRFDVGVSPSVVLPGWLARSADHAGVRDDASLLRVLDAAARMLDGRLNFVAGMRVIAVEHGQCGIPENDPDMRAICAIDSETVNPERFLWRKQKMGGLWSWDDEMAKANAWAREQGAKECRSLIDRFRGDVFAKESESQHGRSAWCDGA